MVKTDLHIHSNYSTGTQSPAEAIEEALAKGITFISFTDDDTMAAYAVVDDLARHYGVAYVKGVQISASQNGGMLRLLAYDCDPQNARLQSLLSANTANWDEIGLRILRVMAEEQPAISLDEYVAHKRIPANGGFKFQNYLSAKGLDGGDEATMKWFSEHREEILIIMNGLPFRPVEEVIDTIHAAGGYAIAAGGYLRSPETLVADVDQLVAWGLDGLEIFSASHSPEIATMLQDYAKAHQLLMTGGGDGHGTFANQDKFAIGIIDVDDTALNLGEIRIYQQTGGTR